MKNKLIIIAILYSFSNTLQAQNPGYLGSINVLQFGSELGTPFRENSIFYFPSIKYERALKWNNSVAITCNYWAGSVGSAQLNYQSFYKDPDNYADIVKYVSGGIDYQNVFLELSTRYYHVAATAPYGKYWEFGLAANMFNYSNNTVVWDDQAYAETKPVGFASTFMIGAKYGIRRMLSDHIGLDFNGGWRIPVHYTNLENGPRKTINNVTPQFFPNFHLALGLSFVY
jgi:hypothetical protein